MDQAVKLAEYNEETTCTFFQPRLAAIRALAVGGKITRYDSSN